MAFQPIVDIDEARIVGHEALVRGPAGEGAGSVLSKVTPETLYSFDQECRVKAIELAARLSLEGELMSRAPASARRWTPPPAPASRCTA